MSPAEHCLTMCATYATEVQRTSLVAALDVRDALVAALQVSDEVRPIKSAWWQEELERLHAGDPRHPATVALCAAQGPVQGPVDRVFAREWLVLAERIRDGVDTETWSDFELDAFRRFGVALALAFLSAEERATDSAMALIVAAAAGLAALDQVTLEDTHVDTVILTLSELKSELRSVPLAVLLATLNLSLQRMTTGRRPPGRVALTFTAWRAARTSQKKGNHRDHIQ